MYLRVNNNYVELYYIMYINIVIDNLQPWFVIMNNHMMNTKSKKHKIIALQLNQSLHCKAKFDCKTLIFNKWLPELTVIVSNIRYFIHFSISYYWDAFRFM